MRRFILCLVPLAAFLAGCGSETAKSDEEFLEEIQQVAEVAPSATYKSPTMIEDISGPMPNIEVETDHYIMGTIPNDRISEGIVKVRNTGEGPLEIKNVTTSCSCTKGRIEEKLLEPGEEVDMIVSVDPKLIPGFEATRVLTIESNDPDMRAISVIVTSYVEPEVEMTPGSANLGAIMAGRGLDRRFVLRQMTDAPLEVNSASCTHQYISVDYALIPEEQWLRPGHREYEMMVHVSPDAPIGRLDSKISLRTNLARTERLQYEVSGAVHIHPYNLVPRSNQFYSTAPGTLLEDVFRITADGPVVMKTTNSTSSDMELIARQPENSNEVIFDVRVGPEVPAGRVSQLWDITFDVSGSTYSDQVVAIVNTTSPAPESD